MEYIPVLLCVFGVGNSTQISEIPFPTSIAVTAAIAPPPPPPPPLSSSSLVVV
jgi:hypothetical protein